MVRQLPSTLLCVHSSSPLRPRNNHQLYPSIELGTQPSVAVTTPWLPYAPRGRGKAFMNGIMASQVNDDVAGRATTKW